MTVSQRISRSLSPRATRRGLVVMAFATLAVLGCGKKGSGSGSGSNGRDPVKICEALTGKGFVSGCAPSTSPLDPALAGATQLVAFTASHEPGGSGQLAIFPDEASAKTAFMTLRGSRGNLVGDYPTKIVIYWEMAGDNARADDGLMGAIRSLL